MKKLLCYLGIVILFVLALFPPVLRIFLPDKGEEKNEEDIIERVVLLCASDTFITNTSYENNKIQMILIKKLNQTIEPESSENPENSENLESFENLESSENPENSEIEEDTSELGLSFADLKSQGDVIYTKTDDGEVLQIDFSVFTYDTSNLENFTKSILEQKNYYEQQGLSCIIRK